MTLNSNTEIFTHSLTRKRYTAPRLLEYGSVAKLTQGSLTVGNDQGAGKKNHGGKQAPGQDPNPPRKRR